MDVDSSDESDLDDDLDQPAVVKTKHHDLMMKSEGSRKGSFFKQAKKSYPMFPTHEERIKWDEYGEIIRCLQLECTSDYRKTYTENLHCGMLLSISHCCGVFFRRLEDFLVPELQATEEEKSKMESGLTNGDEPMDQDLSVVPTKCISSVENLEIRSVILKSASLWERKTACFINFQSFKKSHLWGY